MLSRLFNLCLWLSGGGLLCFSYALLIEPSRLVVREVEFLSAKYSGPDMRIVLMTDIHINGLHVPPERVQKIVEVANGMDGDLILIPGDFVSGHMPLSRRSSEFNGNLATGLMALSELNAPTFATIGNHDAWYDVDAVSELLVSAGVTVLENESEVMKDVCIVGLADALTSSPQRSAYSDCPSNTPPVVFTHSPEAWPAFRSDSVLALAGHTHGGQVNLPLIGRRVNATSLGPEHSYGFSKLGGVDIFVSAGIGTSMLPIRFRAPPEIVVITLRAQQTR